MAREFICLYFSWLETGVTLTDEEFGRMCRAGLQYGLNGTEPDLPGNDKILFPVMKWQVDRDVSKFDEICQKRREAGSRGGKSKSKQSEANQANATFAKQNEANQANATFAKQNEANQANASNTKKNTKTNTKTTIISSSTATAESDISACVQAYEQNIGPIARAAFDDISRQLTDLPADLICEAIGEAALNNKRSWNYVKAILKRCREQNILSVDAYRAEKESHAAAAAARAAPAVRPQSKQAAVRERLKKRLEEMGGAQSDDPADNRIYVEATELVAEPLPGE